MVRKNLSIFLGRIALDVLGTLYLTFFGSYQEFGFQQRIYHKPRKIRMASRAVRFEWVGTAFSGHVYICMYVYVYIYIQCMMYIKLVCIYIYISNFIDSFIYFLKLIYLFIYLEYIYICIHIIYIIYIQPVLLFAFCQRPFVLRKPPGGQTLLPHSGQHAARPNWRASSQETMEHYNDRSLFSRTLESWFLSGNHPQPHYSG